MSSWKLDETFAVKILVNFFISLVLFRMNKLMIIYILKSLLLKTKKKEKKMRQEKNAYHNLNFGVMAIFA